MTDDLDPSEPKSVKSDKAILKLALQRFKLAAEAEQKQRQRELDDLTFEEGKQWDDAILEARKGDTKLGTPPRPCLVINKLKAPIRQVLNQQRAARLAIQINPKSGGATQETAEVLQGLIRHIEVESNAQAAIGWAFERAVKCGRGFYRILTEYSNDGDFDLDIVIKRILNQASVYLDPFATEPDWSDGEWAFVTEDIPAARFKKLYSKSKLAKAGEDDLHGIGDDSPGWVGSDTAGGKVYRVAEYWYVEKTDRTRVLAASQWQGWVEEHDPDLHGEIVASRTVEDRVVKFCKITAMDVLEKSTWDGRYIPIIPVIGDEYNINGVRSFKGIVHDAKDAQREYNYERSQLVESIGLAPRSPYVMVEGQNEGYEEMWATANVKNYSALIYKPVAIAGQPAPPPQRNVVEPAIQAISQAIRDAENDIKSTTGVGDPSLGQYSPQDRSGKAIQALQRQSEHINSNYLDNLATNSLAYAGKVLVDLIPAVYDRPGRIIRILGEDNHARTVMLNQPFVQGTTGSPQPAPETHPNATKYDLSQGYFAITVSVGKSHQNARKEGVELIGELLKAAPDMAPVISDLWIGDMDFPAARVISERLKKMLPPQLQGEEGDPAMAQQQVAQMQQGMQEMSAQMQQMQQVLQTKQIETDAKKEIELAKIRAKQELEKFELESKERIERMKVDALLIKSGAEVNAAQQKTAVTVAAQQQIKDAELRESRDARESQRAHEAALAVAGAGDAMRAQAAKKPTNGA